MPDTPKESNDAPKVFDISRPGRSAPSASGRPIIVTNRPVLQDPMMREDEESKTDAPIAAPSTRISIKPHFDEPESPEEPTADESMPVEPTVEPVVEPVAVVNEKPMAVEVPPEEASLKPETTTAPAVVNEDSETSESPKQVSAEISEDMLQSLSNAKTAAQVAIVAEAKPAEDGPTEVFTADERKQASIAAEEDTSKKDKEKLVLPEDDQEYPPLLKVRTHPTTRQVLFTVLILLIVLVASTDFMLDFAHTTFDGVKPVTHFFKVKT